MITIPTVLVFGAGVSRPFGFPLGIELRNQIINNLGGGGSHREIYDTGFEEKQINSFRDTFRDSGKESVDAFLEHRTEFLEVGKAAIAQELTRHEAHGTLFANQGENLYFYLYKHLNAAPDEFSKNKLTVVTFNYDRSFEHFLFTALRNTYGLTDKTTAEMLKYLPVIHVHGHMGLLPWQGAAGRAYASEPQNRLNEIRIASKNIRIIHEQIDVEKDPEFQRAYNYICNAQRLIFLGFGYDKTNLHRLRLAELKFPPHIIGSCFHFTRQEITDLNREWFNNDANFGEPHLDALNVLRESVSLS